MGYVLLEKRVGDLAEFQAGKRSAWFEHPVCFFQDIGNGSAVSDTECNRVKIVCVI